MASAPQDGGPLKGSLMLLGGIAIALAMFLAAALAL